MDMRRVTAVLRRILLKFNLTRLLTFGYRSDIAERNILVGYLTYMLLGFGLLMLPWSNCGDNSWIDNLFTAASAISTTGLATVEVCEAYTLFGQFVILFLVQLGAIGYMTLSSYILFRLTHHATNYTGKMVNASIGVPYGMKLRDLINNVVHFTVIFEAVGFVMFYIVFSHLSVDMAAWKALFLAVSSFGTAGFSPFPDSLCLFDDNVAVNAIVAALSYAGAMGFIVITDLTNKLKNRDYTISFTTKVIMIITGIMTVGGTLILLLSPGGVEGHGFWHRLLYSFFQTMSAMTTVGFNTIDMSTLRVGPILIFSLIMFVGASPSGTGGGVKCTSISAVWGFIISRLGLRKEVTFLGRVIPMYRVDSALTNIFIYGIAIFTGCLVLAYCEPFKLSQILFEATSAIGTVGLSTGITSDLSITGKLVIISLMYIGRVGVITFGSALVISTKERRHRAKQESDLVA